MTVRAIALLFALAALLGLLAWTAKAIDQRGYDRARAEADAKIQKQKAEAAATLAAETEKVRERSRFMNAMLTNQNLKDSTHEKTVADLADRLRLAAGPAGRLRDPHATGCGGGGGGTPAGSVSSADGGAADRTEAGGLLSAELTQLLQHLAREADAINVAYTSCRADAYTVRAALP